MTHFKIVINCGACEDYIDQCLASAQEQTYTNFEAFVTVDPCGDRTFERAVEAADDDARIRAAIRWRTWSAPSAAAAPGRRT